MRKIIGVYCITNLINEKIYIGSSSNIEDRWEYHRRLGKVYDGNRKNQLYNDIFLYGIENFDFKVVKECSISELESEEQKEIDKYPKSKIYNFEKKSIIDSAWG